MLHDLRASLARVASLGLQGPAVQGDVLDPLPLSEANREHQVDHVVHLSALMQAPPLQIARTNCMGTTNVLEVARLNGVRRDGYASSVGIYPARATLCPHELVGEDVWVRRESVYGSCKVFMELEAEFMSGRSGSTPSDSGCRASLGPDGSRGPVSYLGAGPMDRAWS